MTDDCWTGVRTDGQPFDTRGTEQSGDRSYGVHEMLNIAISSVRDAYGLTL